MAEKNGLTGRTLSREKVFSLYDKVKDISGETSPENFYESLKDRNRLANLLTNMKLSRDDAKSLVVDLFTPSENERKEIEYVTNNAMIGVGPSMVEQEQSADPEQTGAQKEVEENTALSRTVSDKGLRGALESSSPLVAEMAGHNWVAPKGIGEVYKKSLDEVSNLRMPGQTEEEYQQVKEIAEKNTMFKVNNVQLKTVDELDAEIDALEKEIPNNGTFGKFSQMYPSDLGGPAEALRYAKSLKSEDVEKMHRLQSLKAQRDMAAKIAAVKAAGDNGVIAAWAKGLWWAKDMKSWLSFGLSDALDDAAINDIYEKASKGERLTDDEMQRVMFRQKLDEAIANAPKAYRWGEGFAQIGAFGLELAATGALMRSISVIGKASKLMKVGTKGARMQILRRLGAEGIVDAVMVPATPMFWRTLTEENMRQYNVRDNIGNRLFVEKDGKSAPTMVWRSYAQTFAEIFTESIGGVVSSGISSALMSSRITSSMFGGALARWQQMYAKSKFGGLMTGLGRYTKPLRKYAKIGNILEEEFEEIINVPLTALLLWDKGEFYDEGGNPVLADPDFYARIALDTFLLNGASMAVGGAHKAIERKKLNGDYKNYKALLDSYNTGMVTFGRLNEYINGLEYRKSNTVSAKEAYRLQTEIDSIKSQIRGAEQNGLSGIYVDSATASEMEAIRTELSDIVNNKKFYGEDGTAATGPLPSILSRIDALPVNPFTVDFIALTNNVIGLSMNHEGMIKGMTAEMEKELGDMVYLPDAGNSVRTVTDNDGNRWYALDYDETAASMAVRDINNPDARKLIHTDDIAKIDVQPIEDALSMWLIQKRTDAPESDNPVTVAQDIASVPSEVGTETPDMQEGTDEGAVDVGTSVMYGGKLYSVSDIADGEAVLMDSDGMIHSDTPVPVSQLKPATQEEIESVNGTSAASTDVVPESAPETKAGEIGNGNNGKDGKETKADGIADELKAAKEELAALRKEIGKANAAQKAKPSPKSNESPIEVPKSEGSNGEYIGKVSDRIKSLWDNTKHYTGRTATKYVGDRKLNIVYRLTEQGAVTPSHDWHTFSPIPDFIQDENGNNANSRAYEQDTKKGPVLTRAANYNGKAFQDDVYIKDGAVISGNGRTMSGYLAAENGTDTKYIEDLKAAAEQYGFTPEQVAEFEHPRIYAEIMDDIPLTSDMFDVFNKPTTEGESMVDRAIAFGKKASSGVIDSILSEIGQYETMSEFYTNESSCDNVIRLLLGSGFITENQMPLYYDSVSRKFTVEGKALLESALLGSVLDATRVRMLNADKMGNIRGRIARCINHIVKNRTLGEFSLYDEINTAIEYLYGARESGVNTFGFSSYLLNVDMFNPKVYDTTPVLIALNMVRNDAAFRDFMKEYNTAAESMNTGELDFGAGFNDFTKEGFTKGKVAELEKQLENVKDNDERDRITAELNAVRQAWLSQESGAGHEGGTGNNDTGGEGGTDTSQVAAGEDAAAEPIVEESEGNTESSSQEQTEEPVPAPDNNVYPAETPIDKTTTETGQPNDERDLDGFLNTIQSPMLRGKADKLLRGNRAKLIEDSVAFGKRFVYRRRNFRGKNIVGRLIENEDGTVYDSNKTEFDYARYLGGDVDGQAEFDKVSRECRYYDLLAKFDFRKPSQNDFDWIDKTENYIEKGLNLPVGTKEKLSDLKEYIELYNEFHPEDKVVRTEISTDSVPQTQRYVGIPEREKTEEYLHQKQICDDIYKKAIEDNSGIEKIHKRIPKVNIYRFIGKKDYLFKYMNGAYHDNGVVVGTDNRILVAMKDGYNPEYEGKIIDKKGNEISAKYPKWRSFITNNTIPVNLDVKDLYDFICGVKASDKYKDEGGGYIAIPLLDGEFASYDTGRLEKFCEAVNAIGGKITVLANSSYGSLTLIARNGDETVMMVSSVTKDIAPYRLFPYTASNQTYTKPISSENTAPENGTSPVEAENGQTETPEGIKPQVDDGEARRKFVKDASGMLYSAIGSNERPFKSIVDVRAFAKRCGIKVEMISEEEANAESGNTLRTSNGIVYGYTKNGIIYLNRERLNPNTPIHEYTHLWDAACQQRNPELWRRGKELMKQTSVWADVVRDENYASIRDNEDAVASEVHSRLSGKNGAEMLSRMADEGNTATEKITATGLVGKLKRWLSDFWKWTRDTFAPWTKEEADEVTLDEFVNMPLGDLVMGKNPNGPDDGQRRGNILLRNVRDNVERTGHLSPEDIRAIDETIKLYENGEYVFERLLPEERVGNRGSIQEGRGIVGLQIAANIKRTGVEAGGRTERKTEEQQQNEILKDYSDAEGLSLGTYDDAWNKLTERFGEPIDRGSEAVVWLDTENGRVYKLKSSYYDTPAKSIDALTIHNSLFPDTSYTVEGTAFEPDRMYFIVSQKYVVNDNNIPVTDDDIEGYLKEKGFRYTMKDMGNEVKVRYTDGRILLSDMHEKNVYRDAQTGDLRCIDCIAKFNTPDAGFGGDYDVPDIIGKDDTIFEKPIYTLSNTDNGFYSNAAKAVIGAKMDRATPQQWKNMLIKDGGLKAGEDKWIGLSEWLDSSDKKTLTKDEVLEFVNSNAIRIEEVKYSENFNNARQEYIDNINNALQQMFDEYVDASFEENPDEIFMEYHYDKAMRHLFDETGSEFGDIERDAATVRVNADIPESYIKRIANYFGIKENADPVSPIDDIRIQYTTSGLENKREIALTVPTIESWNEDDETHFRDAGEGRAVAWARFGDAVAKDGKKVLFIDEIQSKRHQEGREKGYLVDEDPLHYENRMNEKYGTQYHGWSNKATAEENEHYRMLVKSYDNGIPSAPFEKNWHELAMKRMLRLAAEEGYDYVAWTTGSQQAERYSLSKVIDKIHRNDSMAGDLSDGDREIILSVKGKDDAVQITVSEDGMVTYSATGNNQLVGNSLASVVGKGYAEKIMAMNDNESLDTSDDLEFGGEGMRGFYDSILPKFMDKYGKKWGVRTEDIFIPELEGDGVTAHAVPVTDNMRESVMQGQPMFDMRPDQFNSNDIGRKQQFRELVLDRLVSIENFIGLIKKRGGKTSIEDNAYMALDGAVGASQGQLGNYERNVSKPLAKAIVRLEKGFVRAGIAKNKKKAYEDVKRLFYAFHAKERNRTVTIDKIKAGAYPSIKSESRALAENALGNGFVERVISDFYDNMFAGGKNRITPAAYGADAGNAELFNAVKNIIDICKREALAINKTKQRNALSGMTDKEADEIVARLNKPELRDAIEEVRRCRNRASKFVRDMWLKYGAISQETYDRYGKMYKEYLPLRGWEEVDDIDWDGVRNQTYRGADLVSLNKSVNGRSSLADDPFAYFNQMAVSAVIRGNRNLARIKMFNLIRDNAALIGDVAEIPVRYIVRIPEGETEIWYTEPTETQKNNGYMVVRREFSDDYKRHETYSHIADKEVPVSIGGQRYRMAFKGDYGLQIAKALKEENLYGTSEFIRILSTELMGRMKAMMTFANPKFWLNNFRDAWLAMYVYHLEHNSLDSLKYNMNLVTGIGKVFLASMDMLPENSKTMRQFRDFEQNGGATGWVKMNSINRIKREMKNMRMASGEGNIVEVGATMGWRMIRRILTGFASVAELAPRFAAYVTEVERGRDKVEAARTAREITVNFNKRGTASVITDMVWAFFTPTINAADRVGRAMWNHPVKASFDLALLTIGTYILAMMAAGDDDDDNNSNTPYDGISDYVKLTSWLIPIGDGKFVAIQKPQNIRGLMNIAEQVLAVQRGKRTQEEALRQFIVNTISDVSPLDVDAFGIDEREEPGKALIRFFMPTLIAPLHQASENRDFLGRAIHRDYPENATKPRWHYAGKRTSDFYVQAARRLNNAAGGTDYRSAGITVDENGDTGHSALGNMADMNPSVAQHIFEGYFGGWADLINEFMSDKTDEMGNINYNNIPLVNVVIKQPYVSSSFGRYYEIKDRMNEVKSLIREAVNAGSVEEAMRIKKANYPTMRIYDAYEKKLNKMRKALNEARTPEDAKKIQSAMEELMTKMVEMCDSVNEKTETNLERNLREWYENK